MNCWSKRETSDSSDSSHLSNPHSSPSHLRMLQRVTEDSFACKRLRFHRETKSFESRGHHFLTLISSPLKTRISRENKLRLEIRLDGRKALIYLDSSMPLRIERLSFNRTIMLGDIIFDSEAHSCIIRSISYYRDLLSGDEGLWMRSILFVSGCNL